jgi:hypothetical protein
VVLPSINAKTSGLLEVEGLEKVLVFGRTDEVTAHIKSEREKGKAIRAQGLGDACHYCGHQIRSQVGEFTGSEITVLGDTPVGEPDRYMPIEMKKDEKGLPYCGGCEAEVSQGPSVKQDATMVDPTLVRKMTIKEEDVRSYVESINDAYGDIFLAVGPNPISDEKNVRIFRKGTPLPVFGVYREKPIHKIELDIIMKQRQNFGVCWGYMH